MTQRQICVSVGLKKLNVLILHAKQNELLKTKAFCSLDNSINLFRTECDLEVP